MKTIYYAVVMDEEVNEDGYSVLTSYTTDGWLTDSYDSEDMQRLQKLHDLGMFEVMESCFECPHEMSKEEIIDAINKIEGFEYSIIIEDRFDNE